MPLESCLIDSSECVGTENAQTFDLTPSETGDRSTFMSKKSKNRGFSRKKCTQNVHRAEKMYKLKNANFQKSNISIFKKQKIIENF